MQMTTDKEGPFEGSRCLAAPANYHWAPATIRRVNEDGSFKIEFDVKEMVVLPTWNGVTRAEISFNDVAKWPPVFDNACAGKTRLTITDFENALAQLGFDVDRPALPQFWAKACQTLFGIEQEKAAGHSLDKDMAYKLFMHAGISAQQCEQRLQLNTSETHARIYWNQLRMGGRDPAELCRPVTLDDTFAALGVAKNRSDSTTMDAFAAFEKKHGLILPALLKRFFSKEGISAAVTDSHPNNPGRESGTEGEWRLQRDMGQRGLKGDYAIFILNHFDYDWAAVFHDNEEDARVYVTWNDEDEATQWRFVAPSVGMFFWDLAQTGLVWYQDTKFRGGKAVKQTDIGLVPT